jgi:hypothetical protein
MGRSTPNPWARGEPSLAKVVKERRDDTAQHRRQTSRAAVPPKPAAGGSMQGFTRAESGSNYTKPSGSELFFEGYTLDGTWNAGPGEAPTLVAPTGSWVGVQDAGWYSIKGNFSANIATVDRVQLKWCTFGGHQGGAQEFYETVFKFGNYFTSTVWIGPLWIPAASAGEYPIGVVAQWDPAVTFPTVGIAGASFDVWRMG